MGGLKIGLLLGVLQVDWKYVKKMKKIEGEILHCVSKC